MFDMFFGWRKTSLCKKLIRSVQCRLKLLKNKRCFIVKRIREDMTELLENGHDNVAFHKVEELYKDECMVEVYELLDHFCEFILLHLSYIRRHKDCSSSDINEAISSLIFASARCGDLPELRKLRRLFGARYGQGFVLSVMELLPENYVNQKIIENLSIETVAEDVMLEVCREQFFYSQLALEYRSKWDQQQLHAKNRVDDEILDVQLQIEYPKAEDIEVYDTYFSSSPNSTESSPGNKCIQLLESSYKSRISTASTSEESSCSMIHHEDKHVIYLDHIEEIHHEDQRLFIFKCPDSPYYLNQSKEIGKEIMLRSVLPPVEKPKKSNHVHPKLPDYDELTATFTAFKRTYLKELSPNQQMY